LDLEPGVLAFRRHISLILDRINFLLIGADEDHAGLFAAWPYVEQRVLTCYTVPRFQIPSN